MRLRITPLPSPLHLVLVEPEIPQNTGSIARLAAATGSRLHLVEPLGFATDEKAVRRAGLDYWHLVQVFQHRDFAACLGAIGEAIPLFFTAKAERSYLEAPYSKGAVLVFGKESVGLPEALLGAYPERHYAIPTVQGTVRSLNLANAVSVVLYEALRQLGALAAPISSD